MLHTLQSIHILHEMEDSPVLKDPFAQKPFLQTTHQQETMTDPPESETTADPDPRPVVTQPENISPQAVPNDSLQPGHLQFNFRRTVCRFNLSGTCRHGDRCWYSHEYKNAETSTDSRVTRHSSTICPRHWIKLQESDPLRSPAMDPARWRQAPEFVPPKWRAQAEELKSANEGIVILCSDYTMEGKCPFSSGACPYVHGDVCKLCDIACLDPGNEAQRKEHLEYCIQNMNICFWNKWSHDKQCGICQEIVWEKEPPSEKKFGLLENCNHVFCLSCIRTWRQSRRNSNEDESHHPPMRIRTCPECRLHSNFFVPSHYYYECERDKSEAIRQFKEAVAKKPCKYFKPGSVCLLGDECFYLHVESAWQNPSNPNRLRDEIEEVEQSGVWVSRDEDDPDIGSGDTEEARDLGSDDTEDTRDLVSGDSEEAPDLVSRDDPKEARDLVRDDVEEARDLANDDTEEDRDLGSEDSEDVQDIVSDDTECRS